MLSPILEIGLSAVLVMVRAGAAVIFPKSLSVTISSSAKVRLCVPGGMG